MTTGTGTIVGVRMLDSPLAAVDAWIAKQKEPDLSRPEAIRRLVEIGLSKTADHPRVLSTSKQGAARAAELASKTVDKHMDPKAPPEEREVRKRKLIEGPSVFRDTRRDRPKKK